MKKLLLTGLIFLLSQGVFANSQVQLISEFKGGLNLLQLKVCEETAYSQCKLLESSPPAFIQQLSCVESSLYKQNNCKPAYQIHKLTYYSPIEIRAYPDKLSVFYTVAIADGQDSFYLVDKKGELISLTTDNSLISKTSQFKKLHKKYPRLSLTNFIYTNESELNKFPQFKQPNKLIFKQEVRDNNCVACKMVAVADISYNFNHQGKYIGTKLEKIVSMD